jgi:hypothetical protein
MINMSILDTPRFRSFSAEQQDIVKAGVELYKHYLHNQGKVGYAEYAVGMSYDEKHAKFNKEILRQAVINANLPESKAFDAKVFGKTAVREEVFALVSEILDVIIPDTVKTDFQRLGDVRNVGWGDSLHIEVPNNKLFVVSKTSIGNRRTEPQRLYNGDVVLIPESRSITIEEDFYRIVANKVDWGMLIAKVSQSMETEISTDVYNALFNTYSTLDTNLKEAAFSLEAFTELAERVEALNMGAKVYAMGTKTALSKIVPAEGGFREQLGAEYNRLGYLGTFHGVELMQIPQKIAPNTTEFGIDNSTIYFFSMGLDKPVKVAFEGETLIFQKTMQGDNADNTFDYTLSKRWDVKVASSAVYGIMKI